MDHNHPIAVEFLTVRDFIVRVKISRSKESELRRRGVFTEGVHYIRIGGSVRYRWGMGLFGEVAIPTEPQGSPNPTPVDDIKAIDKAKRRRPPAGPAVNLDY